MMLASITKEYFYLPTAQALAENTTLTHLVLPCCEIGGDGMAHISASLRNKPLQHLVLSYNHIFLKGTEYLCKYCNNLKVPTMCYITKYYNNNPQGLYYFHTQNMYALLYRKFDNINDVYIY